MSNTQTVATVLSLPSLDPPVVAPPAEDVLDAENWPESLDESATGSARMTATVAKGLGIRTSSQRVYDMSGHRDLLADLAEWAHKIRTHPWEGTEPWPTSSP